MRILVTGAAGFIGFHLTKQLLARGDEVVGVDNLNDYYSVQLKEDRLAQLMPESNFTFERLDLQSLDGLTQLAQQFKFDVCVNLAAQAGVRYSLQNPYAYIDSNISGFLNILEVCRHQHIPQLVFASSSSVYGANETYPFHETSNVDHPLALYAATKKSNELMAHAYASLYGIAVTGLRFFTVYGPWGRPDMALFKFTKNILAGKPIDVYNNGEMSRDFTYVEDIVNGIICTIDKPAAANSAWQATAPDPATSYAPYAIYNIGCSQPTALMDFIHAIETVVGKEATLNLLPMQAGDVPKTYADTSRLQQDFGYQPQIGIKTGVKKFVDWYRDYFNE